MDEDQANPSGEVMIWKSMLLTLLLSSTVFGAEITNYTARLPLGDWQPSVGEIVSALDHLKHDHSLWVGKGTPDLKPWREYRFQYYGIHGNGRRIIFLNAFCSRFWDRAPNWRTEPVIVFDGGSCFFHATFDVVAGKIVSVVINGEA